MSDFLDRYFARTADSPLSLQLLFAERVPTDADALTLALRSYHPEMAGGRAEFLDTSADTSEEVRDLIAGSPVPPGSLGLVEWGPHAVQVVGINAPIPESVLQAAVDPAHYPPELKDLARANRAHALLFYAGEHEDRLEQYVALAAVAAGFARLGAYLVLNESARASIPAPVLAREPAEPGEQPEDMLALLRELPIPMLYGGFVKYLVEGSDAVWMRTHGNPTLGLPDFAYRAAGHHEGNDTFNLFANLATYLRESGREFHPGDTLGVGDGKTLTLREPTEAEGFLESLGEMLVIEG